MAEPQAPRHSGENTPATRPGPSAKTTPQTRSWTQWPAILVDGFLTLHPPPYRHLSSQPNAVRSKKNRRDLTSKLGRAHVVQRPLPPCIPALEMAENKPHFSRPQRRRGARLTSVHHVMKPVPFVRIRRSHIGADRINAQPFTPCELRVYRYPPHRRDSENQVPRSRRRFRISRTNHARLVPRLSVPKRCVWFFFFGTNRARLVPRIRVPKTRD